MRFVYLLLLQLIAYSTVAQSFEPKTFSNLKFRFIGPDGNRMIAAVGEPGNPMVTYAGAASGGLWKTEDMGVTWKSIFDETEDSSVGAI
ncbi:MAG: hypothetical protein ACKO13_02030, partial [Cytophagales bacterium]